MCLENPRVGGSIPSPATSEIKVLRSPHALRVFRVRQNDVIDQAGLRIGDDQSRCPGVRESVHANTSLGFASYSNPPRSYCSEPPAAPGLQIVCGWRHRYRAEQPQYTFISSVDALIPAAAKCRFWASVRP